MQSKRNKIEKIESVKKKYLTLLFLSVIITKVMKMDEIFKQSLLYDFYGELLTAHQRRIYEDVVFNDMSLSEIAAEQGISRQGVHDLVRRCDKTLSDYEEKLKLVEKFRQTKKMVEEIRQLTREYQQTQDMSLIQKIELIAGEISEL